MLWFIARMILLSVCILGEIISLGDRICGRSTLLGIVYYGIIATVFIFCVILPVLRVIFTPEINREVGISPEIISQNSSIDTLANTAISFRLIGEIVHQAGYLPSVVKSETVDIAKRIVA